MWGVYEDRSLKIKNYKPERVGNFEFSKDHGTF